MLQKEVFWIIIACFVLIALAIILAFGYSFFANWKKRIIKLEKKNGHEQYQIDELKRNNQQLSKKVEELTESLNKSQQEIQSLKNQLSKYEK